MKGWPHLQHLLDAGVVLGLWVVDDSKGVLEGDNESFPVENNKEDKKSTDLIFPQEGRERLSFLPSGYLLNIFFPLSK